MTGFHGCGKPIAVEDVREVRFRGVRTAGETLGVAVAVAAVGFYLLIRTLAQESDQSPRRIRVSIPSRVYGSSPASRRAVSRTSRSSTNTL